MSQIVKLARMAAIEALPRDMQTDALVDWSTVAAMLGFADVEYAREVVTRAGVPLVHVSARRKLPTLGSLRNFIRERTAVPA